MRRPFFMRLSAPERRGQRCWQAASCHGKIVLRGRLYVSFPRFYAEGQLVFSARVGDASEMENNRMERFTKDMTIGEALQEDMNAATVLMDIGMHCLGCPASQAESLEDAAMVHGIEADDLLARLNAL